MQAVESHPSQQEYISPEHLSADGLMALNDFDSFFHDMVAELEPISEEQLGVAFDELTALAVQQPDDEAITKGITELIRYSRDAGYIDTAMQMAMTLGAMACTHNHMQNTANEVAGLFDGKARSMAQTMGMGMITMTHMASTMPRPAQTAERAKNAKRPTKIATKLHAYTGQPYNVHQDITKD